ncbi:heterokaryon incompatibility protein-domain-containing protein [Xylariaceae sp. FL1019]|nr:heterokaryon incompatibility protein-domain-containing protein [Xylariaceae sp. FL1019]
MPKAIHDEIHYEGLPDPTKYFRLLRLNPTLDGDASSPQSRRRDHTVGILECELSVWPRDQAPSYYAVSYTWGDLKDTVSLQINGQERHVSRNCCYTLQQVSAHCGAKQYIWVDAICIAQEDLTEKGHQIAIMGDVFRQAALVLACVGEHDDHSRYLIPALKRDATLFADVSDFYTSGDLLQNFEDTNVTTVQRYLLLTRHVTRWSRRQNFKLLVPALFEFLHRPYFHRVWTFLEMRLASTVEILCANESVLGETLFGMHLTITVPAFFTTYEDYEIAATPLLVAQDLAHSLVSGYAGAKRFPLTRSVDNSTYQHEHLVAMITDNKERESLVELLEYTTKLKCSEPRDIIFSILPIVNTIRAGLRGEVTIQSDYKSDVYDLAIEISMLLSGETYHFAEDIDILRSVARGLELHKSSKFIQSVKQRCQTNDDQSIVSLTNRPPLGFTGKARQLIADNDGALTLDASRHREDVCGDAYENKRLSRGCCSSQWPSFASGRRSTRRKVLDRRASRARTAPCSVDINNCVFNKSGILCGILSGHAQAGDWIIPIFDDENDMRALVFREQSNGQLYLIGQGLFTDDYFEYETTGTEAIWVRIRLDMDDFFLFCLPEVYCPENLDVFVEDEISMDVKRTMEVLNSNTCVYPGSTYAEFCR